MNIILNTSIHLDCETWALLVVGGIENTFVLLIKKKIDRKLFRNWCLELETLKLQMYMK